MQVIHAVLFQIALNFAKKFCFREAVKKTAASRDVFARSNAIAAVLEGTMAFLFYIAALFGAYLSGRSSKKALYQIWTNIPISWND